MCYKIVQSKLEELMMDKYRDKRIECPERKDNTIEINTIEAILYSIHSLIGSQCS